MKIVTVTGTDGLPHVFLSTSVKKIHLITKHFQFVGESDWQYTQINKYLYLAFILETEDETIFVCGNIEDFGEVVKNGGTLKNNLKEFNKMWKHDIPA